MFSSIGREGGRRGRKEREGGTFQSFFCTQESWRSEEARQKEGFGKSVWRELVPGPGIPRLYVMVHFHSPKG